MSLITFDAVDFTHPGASTPVLRGITLTCTAGETLAFVGRSGAGKSTLLRLVNRMLLPTAGQVRVEGRPTTEWVPTALRRRVGYVMQDAGLFPHMSVAQNVGLMPRLEQWEEDRALARTRELLDFVGLPFELFGARRPAELSGGQRQRVGVARALALDPPVLLMDEPFGALDPITRREMRAAFADMRQSLRTTVLLVTHDLDEACALAHRVGVIDAGALITLESPDVLTRSKDPRVQSLFA